MSAIHNQGLRNILEASAVSLREARLPGQLAAEMERLAQQVDEPCVLAVVGRMKAGKSTFLNALLGSDVAKVGVTETTATINYFKYGLPDDPSRPVRCYWRGGRYEDVGPAFLDSLQGNTVETLRRAEGIDYLEYRLPNRYLEQAVLVDTPGTSAVVMQHQDRTAEFLQMQRQLQDRHNQDTQRIGRSADAVIYLVGPVARATDQAFLEEFSQATGGVSRAFNAVGVMAKIDLQPELLLRGNELAAKVAGQLKDHLNTVVPISAGIRRAIDGLLANGGEGLDRLARLLQRIPQSRLRKLLDSEEFFLELESEDCPVTPAERRQLLADLPWSVFTMIAKVLSDPQFPGAAAIAHLEELSGFEPLKEVLERHFFKRSRFLRWFRILQDARKILTNIRYKHLPDFGKLDRQERARQDRFLAFVRGANGDPVVATELEQFISVQWGTVRRAERLEAILRDLDRKLAVQFHAMEEVNADFEALQQLDGADFSSGEQEELRALFGLYGIGIAQRLPRDQATVQYVAGRQQFWASIRLRDRNLARRVVAERADHRYGLILNEMNGGSG